MGASRSSKKILMIDAFSTLHVGNGALIDNTYKICREYLGGDIEILSIDASTNEGRFPVVFDDIFTGYGGGFLKKLKHALEIFFFVSVEYLNATLFKSRVRFPWRRQYALMLKALESSDICVSLSGETINDYYRPHMYLRLLTYYLAVAKGKKFVVFPQSIGPVFRPLSKWLLRKSLGKAHTIIARDKESLVIANKLWVGCKVKILFCPDVAVTQESSERPLPTAAGEKKVIGIAVSDIPRSEMNFHGDYLYDLVGGIIEALDKDIFQILLMPSNYKHNDVSSDYRVCLEAKNIFQDKGFDVAILKNEIVHPDIYQGMQRNLFAFVSTRMHVGILATSAGVPTLMINTQHKIRSYMSLMEMDDFVLELHSLTEVSEKIGDLLCHNIALRERLCANNNRLRQQVAAAMSSLSTSI